MINDVVDALAPAAVVLFAVVAAFAAVAAIIAVKCYQLKRPRVLAVE